MSDSPSAAGGVLWAEGTWSGVVTPRGSLLLPPEVPQHVVEELWGLLHHRAGSLTEVLDRLVIGAGGHLARIPDFAVAIVSEGGVHLALRGLPVIEVDGDCLESGPVSTWRELFAEGASSIVLRAPEAQKDALRPAIDAVLRVSRLVMSGAPMVAPWATPATAARHVSAPMSAVSPPRATPVPLAAAFPFSTPSPLTEVSPAVPAFEEPGAASADRAPASGQSAPSPAEATAAGDAATLSCEPLVLRRERSADSPHEPALRGETAADPVESGPPAPPGIVESESVPMPWFVGAASPGAGRGATAPPAPAPQPADRPGDHDGWTLAVLPEGLVDELGPMISGRMGRPAGSAAIVEDVPEPAGTRQALSVICAEGHANPTNYVHCRTCGAELSQPARMIPCPALGRLLVPSGESIELDRPVLIGRLPNPQEVPQLAGETPAVVTVPSPQFLISRNHLLIELDEWSVLARSLSTSNGTTLRRVGASPLRLTSTEPVLLTSGDVLDLGDGQSLVLEDLP